MGVRLSGLDDDAVSFGDNITPDLVNCEGKYLFAGGEKELYRQKTVPVAETI